MEVLYWLIPLAGFLAVVIVWAFVWAVRHGQFDDMEGPAYRILHDDDRPAAARSKRDAFTGDDAPAGASDGKTGNVDEPPD